MVFRKAKSPRLLKPPTVICGWGQNRACFVSTASSMPNGAHRQIKSYPQAGSSPCWSAVTELSGSVQRKALRAGKMASLRSTRNLLDAISSRSSRTVKERCGLAPRQCRRESCVRFETAAFSVSEMMALLVAQFLTCTRTARAISGQESWMGCGDGNLDHQNFFLFQASLMESGLLMKTPTAHCWSAGRAEYTDSLKVEPRLINSQSVRRSMRRE